MARGAVANIYLFNHVLYHDLLSENILRHSMAAVLTFGSPFLFRLVQILRRSELFC